MIFQPAKRLGIAMFSSVENVIGNIAQGVLNEFRSNPARYLQKFTGASTSAFALLENLAEISFDTATCFHPVPGSIIYTELLPNYMQHSGIYVGDNRIVERNREGEICLVSPEYFTSGGLGLRIHVSSIAGEAVGSPAVAERALAQVGRHENYHLLLNNCHQFTSGCLTGNFSNADNLLRMLKRTAFECLGADEWCVWRGCR